jgi:hypothetical protein
MVKTKTAFWPVLHKLAIELEDEGDDAETRAAGLLDQMKTMPLGVVNAHVNNLELVCAALTELLDRAKTE